MAIKLGARKLLHRARAGRSFVRRAHETRRAPRTSVPPIDADLEGAIRLVCRELGAVVVRSAPVGEAA